MFDIVAPVARKVDGTATRASWTRRPSRSATRSTCPAFQKPVWTKSWAHSVRLTPSPVASTARSVWLMSFTSTTGLPSRLPRISEFRRMPGFG